MTVEIGWEYELGYTLPPDPGGVRLNNDDLMIASEAAFSNSQVAIVDGVEAGLLDAQTQMHFLAEGDIIMMRFTQANGGQGFDYVEYKITGPSVIDGGGEGFTIFPVAMYSGVGIGTAGLVDMTATRVSFAAWPTIEQLSEFTKVPIDSVMQWSLDAAITYGMTVLGYTAWDGVTPRLNEPDQSVFAGCLDYAASIYTQRISQADFFTSPEQGSTPQQRYRRLLLASRYVAIA